MKTSVAITIECVGPRCISELKRNSNMMSTSGIIERTKINGMLRFTLKSFADALPNRYASAMCPTANEAFFLLENETSGWLIIKDIGLESPLGARQPQS